MESAWLQRKEWSSLPGCSRRCQRGEGRHRTVRRRWRGWLLPSHMVGLLKLAREEAFGLNSQGPLRIPDNTPSPRLQLSNQPYKTKRWILTRSNKTEEEHSREKYHSWEPNYQLFYRRGKTLTLMYGGWVEVKGDILSWTFFLSFLQIWEQKWLAGQLHAMDCGRRRSKVGKYKNDWFCPEVYRFPTAVSCFQQLPYVHRF